MINLTDFYISLSSAALMLSLLGIWLTAIIPGLDRWSKRFFLAYFLVLLLLCLTGFIELIILRYPVPPIAYSYLMVLESLLLMQPYPMLTVYLLHCTGENFRTSRLLHAVLGLCTVFFVLIIISPFVSVFYRVTPDNQYVRGPLYPFLLLPVIAAILLNLAGVIKRRDQLSRKAFLSFFSAMLPITVTGTLQMFVEIYPLVDISIVLSALSMYSLILSDQIDKDLNRQREIARQQQELANQRSSIMVLQMRPHFIYNTMTSIYCLCRQDPEKARQVVMDFTAYLRKNFTAVASSDPIPFSAELEHVRAYLAVEQAQYEDSLFVEYDTPHTRFRVPPLTLQPIVENAVKHGRDPYAGPFHIFIRTRKTDSGSEITVADDGRGFDCADDSEPHIALKNIRQRLDIMCGGNLTITSNDGGGTLVTVTIPDNTAE